MEEKDSKLLWSFILRTEMYVGSGNKDTISAFIHGYEAGRDENCYFVDRLMEQIENEHRITYKATGWIGQIQRLADKLETDWVTIFKKQIIKLLIAQSTQQSKKSFSESLKQRITGKIRGVNNFSGKDWLIDWFGIVDLKADWFNEMWSIKESKSLMEIDQELRNFGRIIFIQDDVKPTARLKKLCLEFDVQTEN